MKLEYVTSISDYKWDANSQKILNRIKDRLPNTLCKQEVRCDFSMLRRANFLETQMVWLLN